MQLDEYGAAARGVQFVDYPRNERERTVMLNERSDAREAIIALAASEDAALGIIAALGLDNDDELLNMAVAEPVPSDASPVMRCACRMCEPITVDEEGFDTLHTVEVRPSNASFLAVGDLRRTLNDRRRVA